MLLAEEDRVHLHNAVEDAEDAEDAAGHRGVDRCKKLKIIQPLAAASHQFFLLVLKQMHMSLCYACIVTYFK